MPQQPSTPESELESAPAVLWSRVRTFILNVAGGYLYAAGKVWKNEETRYMAMGSSVLITSTLAIVSGFVALRTIFDVPSAWAVAGALFWGFIIFTFDRWIVGMTPYGDLNVDPKQEADSMRRKGMRMTFARMIFAAAIGFVVAEPLVLLLFQDEIDKNIALERIETADRIEAEETDGLASESTRLIQIRRRLSELETMTERDWEDSRPAVTSARSTLAQLDRRLAALEEDIRHELETGPGEKYRAYVEQQAGLIQQRNAEASALSEALGSSRGDEIEELEEEAEELSDSIEAETEAAEELAKDETAATVADGFLAREEALRRVVGSSLSNQLIRWLPALLLIAIDVMPVLLKSFSGSSVHEQQVKYRARIAHLEASSEYSLAVLGVNERHRRAAEMLEQGALTQDIRRYVQHPASADADQGRVILNLREGDSRRPDEDGADTGEGLKINGPEREQIPKKGDVVFVDNRQYQLYDRVGKGGGGEVFLALPASEDVLMPFDESGIVVKVLGSEGIGQSEAQAVRQLGQHPRIVSCRGAGLHGDRQIIAFDYHPRTSLDRWLVGSGQEIGVPVSDLRRWLEDLVAALVSVWSSGHVHMDGKPQNVLVSGPILAADPGADLAGEEEHNRAVLCDFGEVTKINSKQGSGRLTPEYAPPEILRWYDAGQPAGKASPFTPLADIYSCLGGTLYFVLSGGRPPNQGPSKVGAAAADATTDVMNLGAVEGDSAGDAKLSLWKLADVWLNELPGRRLPEHRENLSASTFGELLNQQIAKTFDGLDSSANVFSLAPRVARLETPNGYPDEYREALRRGRRPAPTGGAL